MSVECDQCKLNIRCRSLLYSDKMTELIYVHVKGNIKQTRYLKLTVNIFMLSFTEMSKQKKSYKVTKK